MRTRGGVTEVRVDEYAQLRNDAGELSYDDAGVALFSDDLIGDKVETDAWRPLSCCGEAAPADLGDGVALRHVRTSRGDAAADAPLLRRRGSTTPGPRDVVPAPDAELARYDGILPEGAVGHTTEVREQVLVYGEQLGVTIYFAPYALTAAAHAKLRAALLEREAAASARMINFAAAFAAWGEPGDAADAADEPPSEEEDDEAAEAAVLTKLTKREMELARAALGLPPGFNLALLTSRDVPPKLPREVAALLGRARRFTPACAGGADPQAAHELEVKRFLASNTRAKWDDEAAGADGRAPFLWGNPHVSIIDRVVITLPCDAVAAGRALVDTRGAEHSPTELSPLNDASRSMTAESLDAAGAAMLLVDARADASAILAAARSSGIIAQLAKEQVRVKARRPAGPSPVVRVAVVFVADKEWHADSMVALRNGNRAAPTDTAAMAHVRQMEAGAFSAHKATLREAIKTAVLGCTSGFLDERAAYDCAVDAVQDITFLAVYPRVALGHAASPSIAPPASAADAAALAETCGLVKLARFISGGDGPGPAARAAAAAAADVLRRGLAALSHELGLQKQDPAELARLRTNAAAVASNPDSFVLLDLAAWKDTLLAQLRVELKQMADTLAQACTQEEFGRLVASLLGHPFAAGEAAVPPTEFDGARADAAIGPVKSLITGGELEGVQLYELLISPVVNWEEGIVPDTGAYGQPALPPVLALGWLKSAPTPVQAKAPCAEAQVWAELLGSLSKLYSNLYTSAKKLAAGADDVARLQALLSAREAEFNTSVAQLFDKFATLNDAMWWRLPEAAARTAGAAAAATLLERVRKGKQAATVPKSEFKTVKGTKLGTIERALPRVAAAAASAFCDAALDSLSGMVTTLVADVRELVQQHCDDLAVVSDGSLRHLTRPRLWAALDTHIAASELAARLERVANPAGASDELLPERMLPRTFVAALYGKLKAMLPSGATLGDACDMKPGEHAAAMLAAAADAAQSISAADAASASALLARWRKPDEDPMRRAAWCRVTLFTLQLAFGSNASLRGCEPLRQLLRDVAAAEDEPHTPPSGAALSEKWPDEQTYAMLGLCAKAGVQAGTAAFPLVRPEPTRLDNKTRDWLEQLARLLNNERAAAGGGAVSGGAAAAVSGGAAAAVSGGAAAAATPSTPAAAPASAVKSESASTGTRKRSIDWVGTPVRKRFVADGTKRLEWFDGRVTRLVQSEESLWFRIRYSDGDQEDMTMEELKIAAADAVRAEAAAAPAPSAASWPPRSLGAVRRQVALLQLSAGGGPDTLAALRARFAPDRQMLLHKEDGWLMVRPVTKNGGIGDPQFLYFGDIDADGKPTGMPPGRSLDPNAAAVRVFAGKGAWLAVHHFRSGVPFVMPGSGSGGGFAPQLPSAEAQRVRDAMTPRVVLRDGVACPGEAVKEQLGELKLGTWRWETITRAGGSTAGQVDKHFIAPDGTRMRSLNEVQRYLQSRSGRLRDDDEEAEEDFGAAARRGKKRAAATVEDEGAGPSRQLPKRTAKSKAGSAGFYADEE